MRTSGNGRPNVSDQRSANRASTDGNALSQAGSAWFSRTNAGGRSNGPTVPIKLAPRQTLFYADSISQRRGAWQCRVAALPRSAVSRYRYRLAGSWRSVAGVGAAGRRGREVDRRRDQIVSLHLTVGDEKLAG